MKKTLFKKYKAVAYLPSAYVVFQYMLLRPYSVEDTLFLIDWSRQKEVISHMPNLLVLDNRFTRLHILFQIRICWYFFLIYFLSKRCKHVFISSFPDYTNQCTYYFDHVIYMDDGIRSYGVQSATQNKRGRLWTKFFGPSYPTDGWAAKVEKIYLTGLLPIPEGILEKVEKINLKELWDKRSPAEQQEIIRRFLPEGSKSISCWDVDTLLLTQPLSEDIGTAFTEDEKVEMYRELLSGIDEQTVLIKPHPREKTDYRKYFPHINVLNTLCPMELLIIMGMKVRKAITVNSTAIYNLDNSVEKVIAANDPSPKVKKPILLIWGGEASISGTYLPGFNIV